MVLFLECVRSSGALCVGICVKQIYGLHNSCRRQRSDAVLEPFLEDALQRALEPVRRKIEKKHVQLEKNALKIEKKVGGFKSEKNLECTLSFVECSEPFDDVVLTADVR